MLEDNDPFAQYHYLVTIYTGHQRGAATSSKVPDLQDTSVDQHVPLSKAPASPLLSYFSPVDFVVGFFHFCFFFFF